MPNNNILNVSIIFISILILFICLYNSFIYQMQIDDPSLENGYVELFQIQKMVAINTSFKEMQDSIMFRLFKNSKSYKIQLTSESNISMFYFMQIHQNNYQKIAKQNQFTFNFQQFPNWLHQLLANQKQAINNLQKNNELLLKLSIKSKTEAKLLIVRDQMYKIYELAKFDVQLGTEKMMRESLMYRYERMKLRRQVLTDYLENIETIVKTKNPSLLLELNRIQNRKIPFK